jgi:hypothetical protein
LVLAVASAGCGALHHDSAGAVRHVSAGALQHVSRSAAPGAVIQLGTFAGYIWSGHVRSVGARWDVPRVTPGSAAGAAQTWVAAMASGPAGRSPFIQVGTTEGRFLLQPAVDLYEAFWTDTKHHFHPQLLFKVRPGDVVQASNERASNQTERAARSQNSTAQRTDVALARK